MVNAARVERVLPWILRVVWIGVVVAGGAALDGTDTPSASLVRGIAFGGWFAAVCAMAIPAVISLTATRLLVPLAVPVAVLASIGGADAAPGVSFLVLALLAATIAFSAALGRGFVQASAYGEEDRHLLRPPAAYALASCISWLLWAAAVIGATLAVADRRWILGVVLAVVSIAGAILGWPRWHRLARRWLVVVPIGLVVHDQLVLAETIMLRRQEIFRVRLAPADTEAADLTGPASGHAVEIATNESTTAILAATPSQPRGTVIHLRSCLVAPTRPGRALAAAARRRLPVG